MNVLIPVKINNNILSTKDIEPKRVSFKELRLEEAHIEEFLRENVELIFGEEESLLIVGQQVRNKERGKSDLTAIDSDGNIVLIEIKRDRKDIESRKEPFEFQAIRYAASYAKISSTDELVDKIFAPYIDKYKNDFDLGQFTTFEKGKRIVDNFLEQNNASKTFNKKQRIILVASEYDRQTLSAVSWLISNEVDISCFELVPVVIGEEVYLEINRILPPLKLEDFYVEIEEKGSKSKITNEANKISRANLPRMGKLFEWEIIKSGDIVSIRNWDDSDAKVIDENYVDYKGEKMTFNQWGRKVTDWSTINIYEWTVIKGQDRTLNQLRKEKMISMEQEEQNTY